MFDDFSLFTSDTAEEVSNSNFAVRLTALDGTAGSPHSSLRQDFIAYVETAIKQRRIEDTDIG